MMAVKLELVPVKRWLTISALVCHWMKPVRQRAMSAMDTRLGVVLVPKSVWRLMIWL